MDCVHGKGVGGAHDGADVGVVFKVFDRYVEAVAAGVDIFNNRLTGPITIGVNNVAAIALVEEGDVEKRACRPRYAGVFLFSWTFAHAGLAPLRGAGGVS